MCLGHNCMKMWLQNFTWIYKGQKTTGHRLFPPHPPPLSTTTSDLQYFSFFPPGIHSGARPQLLKSETVVQFGLSSQRMSFMGQVYDGKTVWQLFHSVLITSARHMISVHRWLEEFYSDINVKHVQNPASETSLKCFFSLQDKLLLLLDHLQALDMPPVTVALTRHICFLSRFTRSFFFLLLPHSFGDARGTEQRAEVEEEPSADALRRRSGQRSLTAAPTPTAFPANSLPRKVLREVSSTLVDLNNYIFKRGDFHVLSTQYLPVSGAQKSNVPIIRG